MPTLGMYLGGLMISAVYVIHWPAWVGEVIRWAMVLAVVSVAAGGVIYILKTRHSR